MIDPEPHCFECARLKRDNERLQQEVIRLAQNWLDLKKFVLNQEGKVYENLFSD
jgi:hypothetical protein